MKFSMLGVDFNIYEGIGADFITLDEFFKLSTHKQMLCLGSSLVSKSGQYSRYREMLSDLSREKFFMMIVLSLDGTENKRYRRDILEQAGRIGD